jgi:hypothetical protein
METGLNSPNTLRSGADAGGIEITAGSILTAQGLCHTTAMIHKKKDCNTNSQCVLDQIRRSDISLCLAR